MANFNPPQWGVAHTLYLSLTSQADTKLHQANPTWASGDAKVAKDDGAPANRGTLPVVDSDFTDRTKVVISATEMEADNVTLIFSDASGAEWCDLTINIATSRLHRSVVHSDTKSGTLSTTQCSSNLSESTDDHYNGRLITFITGILEGQGNNITDYVATNGVLTFSAMTEAPGSSDKFVIT